MSKELENKDIGSELCKLAVLLQDYGLCRDIGPLQRAGNSCICTATDTSWSYKLEKIVFSADEVGGRLAADTTDITVSLSVEIEGRVLETTQVYNPLNKLLFDIELDGWRPNVSVNDFEFVYAAWHLDRHIVDATDAKTKYSHPIYHFTFGGSKMEAKGHDIYGNSIIMPSPRLLYPPMDAVLGIDFILQNYIHKDQLKELFLDPEYVEILKNAQIRIWKPFFSSIYSHWDTASCSVEPDFLPTKLFPLYY
ncbi:MAG: hypothetical protein ACO1OO_16850 [Flavisolibacter sp.]